MEKTFYTRYRYAHVLIRAWYLLHCGTPNLNGVQVVFSFGFFFVLENYHRYVVHTKSLLPRFVLCRSDDDLCTRRRTAKGRGDGHRLQNSTVQAAAAIDDTLPKRREKRTAQRIAYVQMLIFNIILTYTWDFLISHKAIVNEY